MNKETAQDLAEHATQLAFEYPDFSCEHVDEWMKCCYPPPQFSADDLWNAAILAGLAKRDGFKYDDVIENLPGVLGKD